MKVENKVFNMKRKFYITTPIYYVNDKPHIGHAYTTIAADIIARYYRLKGYDVFFLTGTDENSQKNVEAAKKAGMAVKKYLDEMAKIWKETWKVLNISYDYFIRTTSAKHKKGVIKFFKKVYKKGDIYLGQYSGLYCIACEAFLTKRDLDKQGLCKLHKKKPIEIKEENYFFAASKYREKLIKFIKKNKRFVEPEGRRNAVLEYLEKHFQDISITRYKAEWGITSPIDKNHKIYVWFDALINYLTGVGYGWDEKKFKKYWPADVHLIAKDILKFHAALWPAMLLSAGLPLPKKVFAHGFLTVDGQKMSKTIGNVVDPVELAKKYPVDAIRFYLFRHIGFGEDGDFSEEKLKETINNELVNDLGNLVYRVLSLAEKFGYSKYGKKELEKKLKLKKIEKHMERLELHLSLDEIWKFVKEANRYINAKKPWQNKRIAKQVNYNLLEALRIIAILLYPFMPNTSLKICKQLGVKLGNWKDCKFKRFEGKIKKGEYLFVKVK